jgi:NAD+ kinase
MVALTGNTAETRALETLCSLAAYLIKRGLTIFVDDEQALNGLPDNVIRVPNAKLADSAELLIAVGGDGSMLHAARIAVAADKPLLGINRGRLGFLADISPSENFAPLDQVIAGQYKCEQRMLLNAQILSADGKRNCGIALNDVVVKREDTGRLLEFKSYVDDRYVNSHGGDGFIVATPTGSTAYALSCGGPIVTPGLDALVLAPICPHTLSDRPIVIPGTSITEIQLGDEDTDSAIVSCDGEVTDRISAGDRLRVAVDEQHVQLIHPTDYDYFGILRSKLHWGRGNRTTSS